MTTILKLSDQAATARDLPQQYVSSLQVALVNADPAKVIDILLDGETRRVAFMNAHCFNVMAQDRAYAAAIKTTDALLPDGSGVAIAGKMVGKRLAANLNGTDLVPALAAEAAKRGQSIYLFGGRPGTADAAAFVLRRANPGLRIVGTRDGYSGAVDPHAIIEDINKTGADIVLVALGVPQQDVWLHRYASHLDARLTMGVGAAFDFLAGNVSRAPRALRKVGSEWMWRLAIEPRRMAKRYLLGNFTFLARSARQALRNMPRAALARRSLDIAISASAAILLAPLFALTALAIKLDSKGPVFFRQIRVGKNGEKFEMLKFRSMTQDAELRRAQVLASSDREGICFKSKTDPRITRVGRVIRRASIDELPQIFNVLRGEMAIVGPRPALPSEVSAYPPRALGRLSVKPGITGIWQVSGRANVSFDKMIEMDLAYAGSRTILLDLLLIVMTFRAVLSGRGAH